MKTKKKLLASLALIFAVSLTLAGVSMYSASADTCALTMREGASVRIGDTQAGTGIRFTATVDEGLLDINGTTATFKTSDAVTEVGMIIVPAYTLSGVGSEDVFTYLQTKYGATKSEISTQFTDGQIQKDKDGFYVAGAIVSIQDANLDVEYQAVPYTLSSAGYAYGDMSDERTISYVFNAALEDTTGEGLADKAKVLEKAMEMNNKLDLTAEGEIDAGLSLAKYACDGYVISNAKFENTQTAETVESNSIDFAENKEKAGLDKKLVITYENAKTLTINADVWSLIIDNEEELMTQMDDYAYSKSVTVATGNTTAVYGYYKLADDITVSSSNPVNGNNMVVKMDNINFLYDKCGFQGVFDGDGHTVSGLTVKHRSLFGVVGQGAIFRNVDFSEVNFNALATSSINSAIFGSWVSGCTVENVSITYNIPTNMYTVGATAPTLCGVLFGNSYANGGLYSIINLKNVTVEALNADSSTNDDFAVFGCLHSTSNKYLEKKIAPYSTENVSIVGASIYGDSVKAEVCAMAWEGLTFKTGKPTVLETVETEIGQTVNFEEHIPAGKEIQSVSLDDSAVSGTSVTFSDKTKASDKAKNYLITTTDGEKYTLPVTVWSLLINEAAELTNGSMAAKSYPVGNAVYGYYKITENLNMTGANNVCQGGTTPMVAATQTVDCNAGFQGVFDGGGYTVSNLVVQYRSLFGSVGKDAVFRNVKFENVSYYGTTPNSAYGNTAILGSWVNGGTVENVTVTYNIPSNYYTTEGATPCYCGVLFGFVYGNGGVYSKINLTNVTITALNATTATNTNFSVLGVLKSSYAGLSGWTTYFNATDVTVTGGAIYGDLKDQSMIKQTGNGFTYNAA